MAGRNEPLPGGQRGAVLLLVLLMLAALAVVSVDLSRAVLLDAILSRTTGSSLAVKPLLTSGETLAALYLVRRNQQRSADVDVPDSTESLEDFDRMMAGYTAALRGDLRVRLEDENSRFPLRAIFPVYPSERRKADYCTGMLVRMLSGLLVRHGYAEQGHQARYLAEGYVRSLLAWGGQVALSREDVEWYLSRVPACLPPGRPPESLEELLLIRWPEMEEDAVRTVLLGRDGLPGLLDICSIHSSGPINVNTMLPILTLSLVEDAARAEQLAGALGQAGREKHPGWYRDVFAAFGIPDPPGDVFAEQSRWVRVHVEAGQGAARLRLESVGWSTNSYVVWVGRTLR